MKLFARLKGGLVSYEGMTEETIVTMLTEQGLVCEFIDEATYFAEVAALEAK